MITIRIESERAAYHRGAEEMREAAARVAGPDPERPQALYDNVLKFRANAIRALPVPEDQ